MRAIVKPWNEIIYSTRSCFTESMCFELKLGETMESINEDEWDAEIYALILIESGVIYES